MYCILGACLTTATLSYTIQHNVPVSFPQQKPIQENPHVFKRIDTQKNHTEIVQCPSGLIFDPKEMKCTFQVAPILHKNKSLFQEERIYSYGERIGCGSDKDTYNEVCLPGVRGPVLDKMDCRKFIDCWDGMGYKMDCASTLLFNNFTTQCDWPHHANCCELWEGDPSQIVA